MTSLNEQTVNDRPNFSGIRALCFDIDGTLSDTDDHLVKRLARWLQFVDFLISRTDSQTVARRIVMAMENPGTYLFGIPDFLHIDHQIAGLTDRLSRLKLSHLKSEPLPIIPGVKAMLEHLRPHYLMAVVSARGNRATFSFLDHYQLIPFFKAIVTGQTCSHTKPFPDPVLLAAKQMNVLPSECVMIGDTTVDMRAGRAAGVRTVGVLCGFGEEEELRKAGADLILKNTPDLVGILLSHLSQSPDCLSSHK